MGTADMVRKKVINQQDYNLDHLRLHEKGFKQVDRIGLKAVAC